MEALLGKQKRSEPKVRWALPWQLWIKKMPILETLAKAPWAFHCDLPKIQIWSMKSHWKMGWNDKTGTLFWGQLFSQRYWVDSIQYWFYLIDRPTCWITDYIQLSDKLDFLVSWCYDWLINWLIGWYVGCLADGLVTSPIPDYNLSVEFHCLAPQGCKMSTKPLPYIFDTFGIL